MRTITITNNYNMITKLYCVDINIKEGNSTTSWLRRGKNYKEVYAEAIKGIDFGKGIKREEFWVNVEGAWTQVPNFQ